MGDLTEFSLPLRLFLKAYPWRRIDPVPWTPLPGPLSACCVALVSSAGFVLPSQQPFDEESRGGDPSFREIPGDVDVRTLVDTHRSGSFDHAGLRRDPNLAKDDPNLRRSARPDPLVALAARFRRDGLTETEVNELLAKAGTVIAASAAANGCDRAVRAAHAAISQLPAARFEGAQAIFVDVAGRDLTPPEIDAAAEAVQHAASAAEAPKNPRWHVECPLVGPRRRLIAVVRTTPTPSNGLASFPAVRLARLAG